VTAGTDLTAHLASGIALLVDGFNVRVGPLQKADDNQNITNAVPEECVFILESGGPKDVTYHGECVSAVDADRFAGEYQFGFTAYTRSKPHDFNGGLALATQVHKTLNRKPPAGYIEIELNNSSPSFVVKDETDHYVWSNSGTLKQAL
jgi:hypothetical protein